MLTQIAALALTGPALAQPLPATRTALVPFDISPFPYRGEVPEKHMPFLDVMNGERHGHTSQRGGVYWEDVTYSDRRVLLSIPKGFDIRRPALIVVFFHGNGATLARDVRNRQQVPRQIADSGLNVVLVAPQFAVDAQDSSAGRFWEPTVFNQFVDEAMGRLATLHGDPRAQQAFAAAPVVLVAYSGGYMPAIYAMTVGGAAKRLRGVILLDALFGEIDTFANWLSQKPPAFFVSAYGKASRNENGELQRLLKESGVGFQTAIPRSLTPRSVTFVAADDTAEHNDFANTSWVKDPIKVLLARVPGFARTPLTNSSGKKR
jgi:hypothetical protein